ncbi:Ubiquitin carboxyl-terminal hydrolase family protein [Perilla frutescens var. hirtella]|uniref:Ubiquitin carboxyl-terminal hydrolase family protein n=1 Tax=Perilla frutescens var. hirtella TaxID=608512 RepID=A0AAD4JRB8_PERFH|nr:Ubiquitin carboxyl-terminal hydrolase family protein [Perilla frutescens var. hirtella]
MAALAFVPPPAAAASVSIPSHFLTTLPFSVSTRKKYIKQPLLVITCSSSPHKLVRDPRLDKHVVKQNKLRFVQKLKTLLLSKPKHFMPIYVLYKCRSYLSLPTQRSVLSMIRRYPTIFELFTIPTPSTPFHAAGPLSQLCVRLTPAAEALVKRESVLKNSIAISLAAKLQKLLMLASPYHRLLLSKLVHLAPDLGLPVNFRSRLCNDHPDKFKVVDTSYGRALELVSWDSSLAEALPSRDEDKSLGLIVDRPLKFKHLRLRKGLNIKRWHHEYLVKFKEFPDVCPYTTNPEELVKESMEAEKRACAVVREVLGMTVEKRTLVDHLTHFRKEFGLSNKLRGMLVRHPELFYVSLKGQRDSVFLVEGYSDKGRLLEKDEILVIKDEMIKLVVEGKRLRREGRKEVLSCDTDMKNSPVLDNQVDDECEDGLDDLFQLEDVSFEDDDDDDDDDESKELIWHQEEGEFWSAEKTPLLQNQNDGGSVPW